MSDFRPTTAQAAAIHHPRSDACVVAGAGSGKTAVLTQRFLELVQTHGVSVRRIAALTFTEKAAGEMKERIARALESAGRTQDREDVEFAPISTIHAFCARLLRLHAVEAGVDPAFALLDEAEAFLLREDALQRTRSSLQANHPDAADTLQRVGASPQELLTLVEAVRAAGTPLAQLAWARGGTDAGGGREDVVRAKETLLDAAEPLDEALLEIAQEVAGEVDAAIESGASLAWRVDAVIPRIDDVKPPKGHGPRPLSSARKELKEALEALRAAALDDLAEREIVPGLLVFFRELERTYARLKDERNVLDFTDLETKALAVLEQLAAEGRRPAHAPAALLVDEYQDTNPLQARILAHLRGPACPLFAVGDPKQSIYRFRGADVRVIQEEHDAVGESGRHLLSATFRSSPSLVDCINALDESIFEGGAAGVEHVALDARGEFRDNDDVDVDFRIVDVGSGGNAAEGREAQAHTIAAWIKDLVARKVARCKRPGQAAGESVPETPLGYGDIAILLRARAMIPTIEDALQQADIPFLTYKGRGYFQADEVVDLLYALRLIQNPADDFALACVLAGPLVAATDEDLLDAFSARERGTDPPGKPWTRLRDEATEDPRHAMLLTRLDRLRREASAGRLGRVVEGVLFDLGLMEAALLQDDGRRRAANLRKAVVVARRLEREGRHDLGDLLRHLSLVRDREIPEAEAAIGSEGEDVVRINTVHSAKGLEYPVVVLPDLQRPAPSARGSARFDGATRWAVKLRHPLEGGTYVPAGFAALVEEDKRRQAEEDRRLLYVAMTRAEERLLLVGHCKGVTKKDGRLARFAGWGEILLDAFGGKAEPEANDIALGDRGRARIQRVDPPAAPAARDVVLGYAPSTAQARNEAARVLEEAAAPVAHLGGTPFVVTVTDLLHFAHSPAAYYRRHLEPQDLPPLLSPLDAEDPAAGDEYDAPDAEREAQRRLLYDEVHAPMTEGEPSARTSLDRASLGRALHAAVEALVPGERGLDDEELIRLLRREFAETPHEGALPLLQAMQARFLAGRTGRRMSEALEAGEDVRREVAFHARIRFPAGERVGPFDSLLVRGAIDLWVPEADGIWIVDLKTNAKSRTFPTAQALADHYAQQLRLYALAAERILGQDVAGARLVLVDPSWGEGGAPEVEVGVSGEALEETRRLCRAFALASLEGRWPEDWRDLLDPRAVRTEE